jgi:hypothetical protein
MSHDEVVDATHRDDADVLLIADRSSHWTLIGASVPGTLARAGRKPMQDACAGETRAGGALLLAVADGSGSARLGRLGARRAVDAALGAMRCHLMPWSHPSELQELPSEHWRTLAHRLLRWVRFVVVRAAAEVGAHREDVACTLTLVYATPARVLVAQIGDGRCAAMRPDGSWHALTIPQRGEHAGETQFLTSPWWRRDPALVEIGIMEGTVDALAILTDGCERVAFECVGFDPDTQRYVVSNTPHAPFLTPNVRALRQMLQPSTACPLPDVAQRWSAFLREGSDALPALRDEPDDKTLVLAVRMGADVGPNDAEA